MYQQSLLWERECLFLGEIDNCNVSVDNELIVHDVFQTACLGFVLPVSITSFEALPLDFHSHFIFQG
jgi:hypothetical protein